MTQANGQAGLLSALRGCASWQDIQNKWSGYGEKLKGDLFEQLVKAYLQLEPEYASKLKHVWLYREVPQAVACKLIMPCGSGKSLTSYWIANKLAARRIVIAVPSLALIRQTLKVWLRETMANHQAVE